MSRIIISLAGRKRSGKETCFKLMYPYVTKPQEFQFATPLKKFCMEVLGLTWEQCYGESSARESPTKYKWSDIRSDIRVKYSKSPADIMSAREVLQVVGTDLLRNGFFEHIWAEAAIREVVKSSAETCILTDGRFPNEIDVTRDEDLLGPAFVRSLNIRIYRKTNLYDEHDSEKALDIYDLRPQQNSIDDSDKEILKTHGYQQITKSLWKAIPANQLPFDYLIDNNYPLDVLSKAVTAMLEIEQIRVEPNLS